LYSPQKALHDTSSDFYQIDHGRQSAAAPKPADRAISKLRGLLCIASKGKLCVFKAVRSNISGDVEQRIRPNWQRAQGDRKSRHRRNASHEKYSLIGPPDIAEGRNVDAEITDIVASSVIFEAASSSRPNPHNRCNGAALSARLFGFYDSIHDMPTTYLPLLVESRKHQQATELRAVRLQQTQGLGEVGSSAYARRGRLFG